MLQVDGNQSCSSSDNSDVSSVGSFEMFTDNESSSSEDTEADYNNDTFEDMTEQTIPVILNIFHPTQTYSLPPTWYEEYNIKEQYRKPVRKTIKRDNRLQKSVLLPIIAVSNLRSLIPKIKNFARDVHECDISLALLTEVWQKSEKKKHIFEIDKLLHMEGLKYISTTRPSSKRGGGAAIVVNVKKFSLEKLDVFIPHNLEIIWGIMRPKTDICLGLREIIAVSFYCPPRSTKKSKLLDHILTTVHMLLSKYPNAGLIIGADKNDLNITSLISGIPRIKQIVTEKNS